VLIIFETYFDNLRETTCSGSENPSSLGSLWGTPSNSNYRLGQADECKVFMKMCQLQYGETTLSVS